MKYRLNLTILLLIACVMVGIWGPGLYSKWIWSKDDQLHVFLVHNPNSKTAPDFILPVYESVLTEEGVPYKVVNVDELVKFLSNNIIKRVPAIILPDGLLQQVPQELAKGIEKYVSDGGNVMVVYDVGTFDDKGKPMLQTTLSEVVGFNYAIKSAETPLIESAKIQFSSVDSRDFWQIPPGNTTKDLMLTGYGVDHIKNVIIKNTPLLTTDKQTIYAYAITENNERFPALVLTEAQAGKVLYVNFPLGQQKANADDLQMRAITRTFLFDIVKIPHVMNTAAGTSGMVINWQLYNNDQDEKIKNLIQQGLFNERLRYSVHLAAEKYLYNPDDNLGFDINGNGKNIVSTLNNNVSFGALGGGGYHWFSRNIAELNFTEFELTNHIRNNKDLIEKATQNTVKEYSSPVDSHPQPLLTNILADLNIFSYTYSGDSGSAPNRTFYGKRQVSEQVIAFPALVLEKHNSLWHMLEISGKKEEEVAEWLLNNLKFLERNRTVRLLQIKPSDFETSYINAYLAFLEKAIDLQNQKKIVFKPMHEFAEFFTRFLQTKYTFHAAGSAMIIYLSNEHSLQNMTVALPKNRYQILEKYDPNEIQVTQDQNYYYLILIDPNIKEKQITVNLI